MKYYRIVTVDRFRKPSGKVGIRRKPFGANANTREDAEFIKGELVRIFGDNYEIQEREVPEFLLAPRLRKSSRPLDKTGLFHLISPLDQG